MDSLLRLLDRRTPFPLVTDNCADSDWKIPRFNCYRETESPILRLSSPRDLLPALSPHLSAPSSSPCASFRDPLTDGFGVNLTAAGLRQDTFAT